MAPVYGMDLRWLINHSFRERGAVLSQPLPTGTLLERVRAWSSHQSVSMEGEPAASLLWSGLAAATENIGDCGRDRATLCHRGGVLHRAMQP